MNITRIVFAGGDAKAMTFVTVSRRIGGPTITASFRTPEKRFKVSAKADDHNDLFALATCVQTVLDRGRGTTDVIRQYFHAIEQMAD